MTMTIDAEVTGVLSGMPALPAAVGREVLERLRVIERAIEDDLLEEGAIVVQFTDLGEEQVVLALIVRQHFAFLDVSTSEEAVAISHCYSFVASDRDVAVVVDRDHRMTQVDHAALVGARIATERTLAMIEDAKALMRTHPAFDKCKL